MFKKILIVCMLLSLVPFMFACNEQSDPNTSKEPENETTESTQTPQTEQNGKKPATNNDGKENNDKPQGNDSTDGNDATTENPFAQTPSNNQESNKTPSNDSNTKPDKEQNDEKVEITVVPSEITKCTYEEYHAMTAETQKKFFEEFDSVEDFFEWYNDAKAKYEKENGAIEIGDGEINVGDIANGKK